MTVQRAWREVTMPALEMEMLCCSMAFKVVRGGHEEIPLIQGKEQWLRFGRAAVKRYPMSKVRDRKSVV